MLYKLTARGCWQKGLALIEGVMVVGKGGRWWYLDFQVNPV